MKLKFSSYKVDQAKKGPSEDHKEHPINDDPKGEHSKEPTTQDP